MKNGDKQPREVIQKQEPINFASTNVKTSSQQIVAPRSRQPIGAEILKNVNNLLKNILIA